MGAMAENIDDAINTLAGLDARNFLIVTVPDLGLTPGARTDGASAAASALWAGFDDTLVNGSSPLLIAGGNRGRPGGMFAFDIFSLVALTGSRQGKCPFPPLMLNRFMEAIQIGQIGGIAETL
jgi:hypothetical protein